MFMATPKAQTIDTVLQGVIQGLGDQGFELMQKPSYYGFPGRPEYKLWFHTFTMGDFLVRINSLTSDITLQVPASLPNTKAGKYSYWESRFTDAAQVFASYLEGAGVDAKLTLLDVNGEIDFREAPVKPMETIENNPRGWGGAPLVPLDKQRLTLDTRTGQWYGSPLNR